MRLEIDTRRFYIGRDYSEAIEALGALPVHIPLIPKQDYISRLCEGLDAVLLPGSDTDVDPAYYSEDPHPNLGRVLPAKDETDRMVLTAAEKLELPILAICYGMQALNVFRGGTLIQDIAAQVENSIKHQQGTPIERSSHFVQIAENSLMEKITSDLGLSKIVKVNSHHHQAISKPGKNLAVSAQAADGVIEAVEDRSGARFVLGVQWHPELSWREDPLSRTIFENFIEASRSMMPAGSPAVFAS